MLGGLVPSFSTLISTPDTGFLTCIETRGTGPSSISMSTGFSAGMSWITPLALSIFLVAASSIFFSEDAGSLVFYQVVPPVFYPLFHGFSDFFPVCVGQAFSSVDQQGGCFRKRAVYPSCGDDFAY